MPLSLSTLWQLCPPVTRWKRLQLSTVPGWSASGVSMPFHGLVVVVEDVVLVVDVDMVVDEKKGVVVDDSGGGAGSP